MTSTIDFLPESSPRSYPIHLQQLVADDRKRLGDLAKELGYEISAWSYLALEDLARWREAARRYRQALVDLGMIRPLPAWETL